MRRKSNGKKTGSGKKGNGKKRENGSAEIAVDVRRVGGERVDTLSAGEESTIAERSGSCFAFAFRFSLFGHSIRHGPMANRNRDHIGEDGRWALEQFRVRVRAGARARARARAIARVLCHVEFCAPWRFGDQGWGRKL